jgi:hypothetical protein
VLGLLVSEPILLGLGAGVVGLMLVSLVMISRG